MSFRESIIMPRHLYDGLVEKVANGKNKSEVIDGNKSKKAPKKTRQTQKPRNSSRTGLTARSELIRYANSRNVASSRPNTATFDSDQGGVISGRIDSIKKSFSPEIHHNVEILLVHLRTHCSDSFAWNVQTLEIEVEKQVIVRSNFVDILRFFLEGKGHYMTDYSLADSETINSDTNVGEILQVLGNNFPDVTASSSSGLKELFSRFTIPRGAWHFLNVIRHSVPESRISVNEVFPFLVPSSISKTDIFKRCMIDTQSAALLKAAVEKDVRYEQWERKKGKENERKKRKSIAELRGAEEQSRMADANAFSAVIEPKRVRRTDDPADLLESVRRKIELEKAKKYDIDLFKGFSNKLGRTTTFAPNVVSGVPTVEGEALKKKLAADEKKTFNRKSKWVAAKKQRGRVHRLGQQESADKKRIERGVKSVMSQITDATSDGGLDLLKSSDEESTSSDSLLSEGELNDYFGAGTSVNSQIQSSGNERSLRNRDNIRPAVRFSP